MELRDLIVTPLLLILLFITAYVIRPFVTDAVTRRYFLPALTVRVIGALAVGFIYQFYYNGGDTYNYHTHGSRHIWEAFMESPTVGLKLLFADGQNHTDIYKYASKIPFFSDWSSYNIIRIAAIFDLFTFSSYSATAVCFGVMSFVGLWLLFLTFYRQYPHLHKGLAIASFFVPSVIFWGSGLLKDTIALTFLCFCTYFTYHIFISRNYRWYNFVFLLASLYCLYSIKVYILLNFLPAAIFWVCIKRLSMVSSAGLKMVLFPFVILLAVSAGFYAVVKASEDNPKYSLDKLGETARITAYDIRYYTGRDAGSGYSLGELDGSFNSMLMLAPAAINVSLFRPYLWEVSNPLMFFSALESFAFLIVMVYLILNFRFLILKALVQPDILFAVIFTISFAFAVGVSTYNFGTLVRYKIPVLPFLLTAIVLIYDFAKRERKAAQWAVTE